MVAFRLSRPPKDADRNDASLASSRLGESEEDRFGRRPLGDSCRRQRAFAFDRTTKLPSWLGRTKNTISTDDARFWRPIKHRDNQKVVHHSVHQIAMCKGVHRDWEIELDLGNIKSVMQMECLRCETPELVRKEIWTHVLAYHLIRTITAQAVSSMRCYHDRSVSRGHRKCSKHSNP